MIVDPIRPTTRGLSDGVEPVVLAVHRTEYFVFESGSCDEAFR